MPSRPLRTGAANQLAAGTDSDDRARPVGASQLTAGTDSDDRAPRTSAALAGGLAVAATVATGGLFFFGTGLHPVAALTWVAPLPVLLLAPRLAARWAFLAGAVGYLAGSLTFLRYYLTDLELAPPLLVFLFGVVPVGFGGVVVLFRALLRRGRPISALVAVPATWSAAEFLVRVLGPGGANWSLGTTQADVLPVVQLASATGVVGLTFLVLLAPTLVAVVCAPGLGRPARWRGGLVGVALLVIALGYGTWRLATPLTGPRVMVALGAPRHPAHEVAVASADGQRILAADLDWLPGVAARGARYAVLPEKDLVATDAELAGITDRFRRAAGDNRIAVVLGVEQHSPGAIRNTALVFPADGGAPVEYHKRFPVVGVEREITPGDRPAFVPGTDDQVGVAICADLGHPELGLDYAGRARLLLAPADDWVVDGWLQGRVQSLRGVEGGYPVARAAREGFLTVLDQRGRVLAQVRDDGPDPVTTATAEVTLAADPTPYSRAGDWFGWLTVGLAALAVITCRFTVAPWRRDPDPVTVR
jgi:apolipoprotein N-acyltransferase